ncbi:unnamed protein product [Ilex paraguariensis]|uniref:Uncharacterized protein n=1 Tax=Ilex paraguariensis TaxID=185542 RepID=A0ABC8UYV9_9AQUA
MKVNYVLRDYKCTNKAFEAMEVSDNEFPGFQTSVSNEFVSKRPLSRLQRRAPRPLQLKPTVSIESKSEITSKGGNEESSSSLSSSSFTSCYHNKDPIPLLSPLVLPSFLESTYIQEESTAKSR